MRKFVLALLVLLSVPALAQVDYLYRIASFMSTDATETYNYQYRNSEGTELDGIHRNFINDNIEVIDSLVYDEAGRIISIQTHQNFGGYWRKVCWIDYTYNPLGLRTSRKNYNDFNDGNGGVLSGTYYYLYDSDNKLIQRNLEFDSYLYEKVTYHYNEDGLIIAEESVTDPFIGTFENSVLKEYYYDENGYISQTMVYSWYYYEWELQLRSTYKYDEVGNCIEYETFNSYGIPQEKNVYSYDTEVSYDEVYHFSNPENSYPVLPQMKNKLDSYEYWALNQDSGQLVFAMDYLFLYDYLGEDEPEDPEDPEDPDSTSVNNISINTRIYPNPTQDYIKIESEEVDFVQLLDICGRELLATEVRETLIIDMKEYEAGIYFVRLHSNGSTSVQKVVKK